MDAWKGKQMHSHVYRVPEPFRNEVTLLFNILYNSNVRYHEKSFMKMVMKDL
ncbi:hypothetical protein HYC85_030152 [Camellia sinensis]|uniref:Uncharacterized protein n=1 Tax=Camellia sinensis TaxID=4442 RepID=A0A7J7G1C6_CAMSI|nr:hypothetical protein HYC85_030152 [Camellia sinensis]